MLGGVAVLARLDEFAVRTGCAFDAEVAFADHGVERGEMRREVGAAAFAVLAVEVGAYRFGALRQRR